MALRRGPCASQYTHLYTCLLNFIHVPAHVHAHVYTVLCVACLYPCLYLSVYVYAPVYNLVYTDMLKSSHLFFVRLFCRCSESDVPTDRQGGGQAQELPDAQVNCQPVGNAAWIAGLLIKK